VTSMDPCMGISEAEKVEKCSKYGHNKVAKSAIV